MNNVELVALPAPLHESDRFEWRGVMQTQTFDHTKVMWKGVHVLTIREHLDFERDMAYKSVLDEDDDDEERDDVDPQAPVPTRGHKTKYLIHTNWEWLKTFYGEYDTLEQARAGALGHMEELIKNIRAAFMLRNRKD